MPFKSLISWLQEFSGPKPEVRRLSDEAIITPSMLPGDDGENINGPSLIRVPEWVSNPIGRYYLYFAHHHGDYVRMAYADDLTGPWSILPGGVLKLADVPAVRGHIASPDAVIDEGGKQVRMYFHGPAILENGRQRSFVAISTDGIGFTPVDGILGEFYFRVFRHQGYWYAISKGGFLQKSQDGLSPFTAAGDTYRNAKPGHNRQYNGQGNVRHVAVHKLDNRLAVYFTRVGDKPERIFRGWIDLSVDCTNWVMGRRREIIRPTTAYEGSTLPLRRSKPGPAHAPENAIRDPAIFVDIDSAVYLLYSVMGERGIAIAEIRS